MIQTDEQESNQNRPAGVWLLCSPTEASHGEDLPSTQVSAGEQEVGGALKLLELGRHQVDDRRSTNSSSCRKHGPAQSSRSVTCPPAVSPSRDQQRHRDVPAGHGQQNGSDGGHTNMETQNLLRSWNGSSSVWNVFSLPRNLQGGLTRSIKTRTGTRFVFRSGSEL